MIELGEFEQNNLEYLLKLSAFMKSSENIRNSTSSNGYVCSKSQTSSLTNWTFPAFLGNEVLFRGTILQSHQIVQFFIHQIPTILKPFPRSTTKLATPIFQKFTDVRGKAKTIKKK